MLNLQNCAFGVTSRKLLDFIVNDKRIEVDPDKTKTIMELPPLKIEKEIYGLLGASLIHELVYI